METAILWNVAPCILVETHSLRIFFSLTEKIYAYKNSCPKLKNLEVIKKQNSMSIIIKQDATIYIVLLYFLQTALHVSDDTLIHHQEHIQTVITTSGTVIVK